MIGVGANSAHLNTDEMEGAVGHAGADDIVILAVLARAHVVVHSGGNSAVREHGFLLAGVCHSVPNTAIFELVKNHTAQGLDLSVGILDVLFPNEAVLFKTVLVVAAMAEPFKISNGQSLFGLVNLQVEGGGVHLASDVGHDGFDGSFVDDSVSELVVEDAFEIKLFATDDGV